MPRTKSSKSIMASKDSSKHRGHNEGSIFQKKNGLWAGQIQVGIKPDGSRKFTTKTSADKKEIVEWLQKTQNNILTNNYIQPTSMTVEDWFWNWMAIYKKGTVSPNTYTRYIYFMKLHIVPAVGKMKLRDLRSTHIQKIYNDMYAKDLAYTSRKHIHTLFYQALQCAVNEGMIDKNYAINTVRPHKKSEEEVSVFTPEEQQKILNNLKINPVGALIKVAIGTGARLGEILGLKWQDVDFNENVISITNGLKLDLIFDEEGKKVIDKKWVLGELKTAKSKRQIPIADSTASFLKQYKLAQKSFIKPDIYPKMVFLSSVGTYWDNNNARNQYKKFLDSIGVPYRKFHALRHTYATRLLENSIHPKVAQELLGHSCISITMDVYSHVLPDQMKEAIEKIKGIV